MDKSMTGDGAVVREWERFMIGPSGLTADDYIQEHNALARHAERLTQERNMFEASANQQMCRAEALEDAMSKQERQQAAEIERLTVMWQRMFKEAMDRAEASEARTADLLKALERYGQHTRECDWEDAKGLLKCTCGLAAAKGETV